MTVELDCLRLFPSLRSTRWTAAAGFFTDEVQLSVKRLSLLLPPSLLPRSSSWRHFIAQNSGLMSMVIGLSRRQAGRQAGGQFGISVPSFSSLSLQLLVHGLISP